MNPDTIVLVHGFWVTPRSREHRIERYEGKGDYDNEGRAPLLFISDSADHPMAPSKHSGRRGSVGRCAAGEAGAGKVA